MSIKFSLILASSLRSSAWSSARYLILVWWEELDEGSIFILDALDCISMSILFNFTLISLVNLETSHSFAKSDATLVKEFSKLLKRLDNSIYLIAICWEMCSSTLSSNFLLAFLIKFSCPDGSSLNFCTASSSCNKMCCVESTSTPIASTIILLALSIILYSLSLSDLNLFYLAFFSKSWLSLLISSIVAVSKSILGIYISVSRLMSSSVSLPVIRSFSGCLCSTSMITGLTLGIDTMVEIEGLAVKNGIGLKDWIPMGVLTDSKLKYYSKLVQHLVKYP